MNANNGIPKNNPMQLFFSTSNSITAGGVVFGTSSPTSISYPVTSQSVNKETITTNPPQLQSFTITGLPSGNIKIKFHDNTLKFSIE